MKTFDFATTARTISYWIMSLTLILFGNVQAQTIVGNFTVMPENALHQDKVGNAISANTIPIQSPSLLSANTVPTNRKVNTISAVTEAPVVQGVQSAPEQSTSSAKNTQIIFPELSAQSSQALRLLMTSPQ